MSNRQRVIGPLSSGRAGWGQVFNDVPGLYDWVHPGYPHELFADLATIAGIDGSGVQYRPGDPLAGNARVCSLTAVEPAR
jgi:hypothetical protein